MTLSAEEYTEFRQLTGGVTTTEDRDHLTDAEIQAVYDDRAGGDFDLTVVHLLRRRYGMASVYVDKSMDVNSQSLSQRREALKTLLKDAEARAGVAGGSLQTGVLDLNIDTDYDDLDVT